MNKTRDPQSPLPKQILKQLNEIKGVLIETWNCSKWSQLTENVQAIFRIGTAV